MNSAASFRGDLEIPANATIADALEQLGLREHLKLKDEQIIFLVNSANAELTQTLKDGEQLLILQSMMGG